MQPFRRLCPLFDKPHSMGCKGRVPCRGPGAEPLAFLPMIDPRTALEAIGQLPDTEIDIADAALQLARVDAPEADWQAARERLSVLARDAAEMALDVPADDLSACAGALAGLIAGRHGYAGDIESYDDPANANLIRVTERKLGLPVSLGIVWLHAARAAG